MIPQCTPISCLMKTNEHNRAMLIYLFIKEHHSYN